MTDRQFDPADAMRMLRCDQTELIALALHLLDHCHQACDGLQLALVSGEWRGVNAILQKVRNGCAVLRADAACELARELELKTRRQSLRAEDLRTLASVLRVLAIDLMRFIADARTNEQPELALAA